MLSRLVMVSALGVALLAGCTRDLETPPPPQHGSVHGVLDPAGKIPADGNPVALVAEDGSRLTQSSGTGGAFAFSDVAPGVYYLDVKLPGFAPLLVPSVRVNSGQSLDLGTQAPVWLGGTPQEAVVSGTVVSSGGGDTNGGQVEFLLQPVNQRVALAAIGVGGVFTQRVPPGTYSLRASHPLYVTAQLDGVVAGEGQNLDLSQPIALALNPASLSGTVLEERDGQTPVPAAGALVTLSLGATTTTDSNGNFQIGGLPAGTETARVTLAGFHDQQPGRLVQLSPGQASALDAPVTLKLDRGTVSGVVQISDAQPATEVEVSLAGTPYNALVTLDPVDPSRGNFQIQNVPVGVYEVDASKPNYARISLGSVTVQADSSRDVGTLTLVPLRGDFAIDDADPNNTQGYSASTSVTLSFSGFGSAASYRASEDPGFGGVSFVPYTGASQPFTLSAQDGTHVVYAQYQDAAGTTSPTFSASVVLDRSAPAQPSVLIDSGAAFTHAPSPDFLTLQSQELVPPGADTVSGLASVRINETGASTSGLLDANPVPYQRDLAYLPTSSSEGPHTVYVQFVDHAGNASAIVSAIITVDTQPPSGSISIADGIGSTSPGLTRSAMVTLNATAAAEPNGGFTQIRLANSQAALASAVFQPLSPSSTWFLDATSEGAKTVYAELQDAAGNRSTGLLSANITYDATPPSPANVSLAGASNTNSRAVTLNLVASDAVAISPTQAVTVSLDPLFQAAGTVGPMPFPGSSQLTFNLDPTEPDGPKQLYVRFRDAAGNDAVSSARLTLDTQAPVASSLTLTGTLADGTTSSAETSTANVTLALQQLGATQYALGNETLTDCATASYAQLTSGTFAVTLSGSASPREVHLCLRDDAGNLAGPLVRTIALDTSTPTGCTLALTGSKVDGSLAPFGLTANPNVTATVVGCNETPAEMVLSPQPVSCTSQGLRWVPFVAQQSALLQGPDGTNTLYLCVRDAARNTGALASANIDLDTQPPVAPLIVIDSGAAFVNDAQVSQRSGYFASVQGSAQGAVEWAMKTASSPDATPFFSDSDFTSSANNPLTLVGAEGPVWAFAVFRDPVGNQSAVATARITFDTVGPDVSATQLAIATPTNNAYTNTVSVTLGLSAYPSDATAMKVADAATPGTCQPSDFSAAVAQPFTPTLTHLLPSGDGLKGVCIELLDAAGNASAPVTQTVTLDTQAPEAPVIETASALVNGSQANPFPVTLAAAVSDDPTFSRYQKVGGTVTHWTDDLSVPFSIFTDRTMNFDLASDFSIPEGKPNLLQVRAVDLAGNVSAVASVLITKDISPPNSASTNITWVFNESRQGTVHWLQTGTQSDIVGYDVFYGSASGSYNGTNAAQGPSPLRVTSTSVTLSNLVNGSPVFVAVRPVDKANNVGPMSQEVVIQPNAVSPTQIAQVPGTGTKPGYLGRMVVQEDVLYAIGFNGDCSYSTPAGTAQLQIYDLSQLRSPVRANVPDPTVVGPPLLAKLALTPDVFGCETMINSDFDLAVDLPYAFVAVGGKLRIIDVSVPSAPQLLTTLDFGANTLTGVAVRSGIAFLNGVNNLVALDLGKLYDGNPTTFPTVAADVIGSVTTGNSGANPPPFNTPYSGGIAITHNQLLQTGDVFSSYYMVNLANAIDGNAGTPWDNTQISASGSASNQSASYPPPVSGNYLYAGESNAFRVWNLTGPWAGGAIGLVSSLPISTYGQFDVRGSQAFVNTRDSFGVRVLDLTNPASIVDQGLTLGDLGGFLGSGVIGMSNITYGNYLLAGDASGNLVAYEIATPLSIHSAGVGSFGEPHEAVSGSFLVSGGQVIDLQANALLASAASDPDGCSYDSVVFGETTVLAQGPQLRVLHLRNAIDRNPGTVLSLPSDSYTVTLPANTVATGVARYGERLIVAERRTSGTAGMYLEVFDARKIDNGLSQQLALTDSLGSVLVIGTTGRGTISMHRTRAVMGLETEPYSNVNTGMGLYVTDLAPLLDDDSSTSGGVNLGFVQASTPQFPLPPFFGLPDWPHMGARQVVARGSYAYMASAGGLDIIDISEAMQQPGVVIGSTGPVKRALQRLDQVQSVAVYGSYAYVVPLTSASNSSGVTVIDISQPLSPVLASSFHYTQGPSVCSPSGLPSVQIPNRNAVEIAGSRAYVGQWLQTFAYDLE